MNKGKNRARTETEDEEDEIEEDEVEEDEYLDLAFGSQAGRFLFLH